MWCPAAARLSRSRSWNTLGLSASLPLFVEQFSLTGEERKTGWKICFGKNARVVSGSELDMCGLGLRAQWVGMIWNRGSQFVSSGANEWASEQTNERSDASNAYHANEVWVNWEADEQTAHCSVLACVEFKYFLLSVRRGKRKWREGIRPRPNKHGRSICKQGKRCKIREENAEKATLPPTDRPTEGPIQWRIK